jgi:hypothetical protein
MRLIVLPVAALALTQPAMAEEPLRLSYKTYAVGLHIADAEAALSLGPLTYEFALSFRTTGIVGVVVAGQNASAVHGTWNGDRATPRQYTSSGTWRGDPRTTLIDYDQGIPVIRELLPPLEPEREVVPDTLRAGTTDSLTALVALIRTVARSGRCENSIRTFDGRRATEIVSHTAGRETLEVTGRSSFAGPALRCDFASRVLAGLRTDEVAKPDYRPLRGSAWLAAVAPDRPIVPVRMTVETRWFGDATSYLTGVERSARQ